MTRLTLFQISSFSLYHIHPSYTCSTHFPSVFLPNFFSLDHLHPIWHYRYQHLTSFKEVLQWCPTKHSLRYYPSYDYDPLIVRDLIEERIRKRLKCECQIINNQSGNHRKDLINNFGADVGAPGRQDFWCFLIGGCRESLSYVIQIELSTWGIKMISPKNVWWSTLHMLEIPQVSHQIQSPQYLV